MISPASASPIPAPLRKSRSEVLRTLSRATHTTRGCVGLVVLSSVVAVAVIGPFFAPHSPTEFVTTPFAQPSSHALLGGDALGRDVLSRVLDGGRILLAIAVISTVFGVGLGVLLGLAAAYLGGRADSAIMRIVDVVLAFPQLVFALLLISMLGARLWLLCVAVIVSHAPQVARVVRAGALDVAERDFVRAAELQGESKLRVMWGEVLPSLTSIVMVELGLRLTFSILIIAGLSFIGFGLQPPDPNWALMINENRIGMIGNPWAVLAPIVLVAMLTVGVNTYTDAVARASLGLDRQGEDYLLTALAPQVDDSVITGGMLDVAATADRGALS
jgi:peptide/nickel transport system permease protein